MGMSVKILGLSLGIGLSLAAWGQPPLPRPAVVALLAAVGDRIDFVRQKEATGSNIEPFTRQRLPVNGQVLNFAVLRGLDRAIAEEEPQSQRVLLKWSMPPEAAQRLEDAAGQDREAIVLDALLSHLQSLPERAQWDRVEAIVPSYFFGELRGMGRKLSGIGIYVQPLQNESINFGENGELTKGDDEDGNNRTINPNTGATGKSSTFVAPYMYFQRITIDARSLKVLARKRQFDNTKYADPDSPALDVMKQVPLTQLMGKLLESVERSAYQSVRGSKSEVKVGAPVVLPGSAPTR